MRDPIGNASVATRALNVIVAIRRRPGATAAQIVTDLNALLDDPRDDIGPITLSYVTSALALALSRGIVADGGGTYTLVDASRYARRVGDTDIELGEAAFTAGKSW